MYILIAFYFAYADKLDRRKDYKYYKNMIVISIHCNA